MKKLEDLSKENIFKVPDEYFEKLPGIIQARITKPQSQIWFAPAFKFALPTVALVVVLTVWITSRQDVSWEEQLNEIQTEHLMAYLEENDGYADLSTEEINLNEEDLYELEETVISSMNPLDITIDELTIESDNL